MDEFELCPECDSNEDVDIVDVEYEEDGSAMYETRECHLCETTWETTWKMVQDFSTIDGETGYIEIYYTIEFNVESEGPFLKEERDLIQNIGSLLTGYINSYKARDLIRLTQVSQKEEEDIRDV